MGPLVTHISLRDPATLQLRHPPPPAPSTPHLSLTMTLVQVRSNRIRKSANLIKAHQVSISFPLKKAYQIAAPFSTASWKIQFLRRKDVHLSIFAVHCLWSVGGLSRVDLRCNISTVLLPSSLCSLKKVVDSYSSAQRCNAFFLRISTSHSIPMWLRFEEKRHSDYRRTNRW